MLPRFNYPVKRESRIRKVSAKNVSAVKGQMIAECGGSKYETGCLSFSVGVGQMSSGKIPVSLASTYRIKDLPFQPVVAREKKKLCRLYSFTIRDNFNYSWEWVAGGTTNLASIRCKGLKRIDRSSSRRTFRHDSVSRFHAISMLLLLHYYIILSIDALFFTIIKGPINI